MNGKRRRGRPNMPYSSNITHWMSESMEQITRDSSDRVGLRRLVRCAARADDHQSWWNRERRKGDIGTISTSHSRTRMG